MRQSVLDWDATTVAEKIRSREISCEETTRTYIHHLQKVQPTLNILAEDRFEQAIEEAQACDRKLRTEQASGALFGVPITVKESFDVKGMKTTGGLLHRKDFVAREDATVVMKLKQAGAIFLGKSNTPTLCFCQETDNKLYGRSNNPWDITRTTGGSSGGEGALLAVGGSAVGIGSDIGGSIRFPAHFNGVIGFKSGNQQVSQVGHFPYTDHELQARMLGIGALSKSVRDAELINQIISNGATMEKEILEPFSVSIPAPLPQYPMGEDTLTLLTNIEQRIAASLSHSFVTSIRSDYPPMFDELALLWQLIMSIDGGESIAKLALEGHSPWIAFLKERLLGNSRVHHYLSWALIGTSLFKPSPKQVEKLYATLHKLDEEVARYFTNNILVIPVYHTHALPHGEVYQEIFSIRKTYLQYLPYIAVANTLGLPSLVIPVGVTSEGLPLAVQLISSVGNEQAIFELGKLLEPHVRGYVRCTKHD